jgi:transposase-like protein
MGGKRSADEWIGIRRAYEAPGANVSQIARACGIHRSAILQKAKRQGWHKGEPVETSTATSTLAVETPAPVTALPADIRRAHCVEWHNSKRLREEADRAMWDQTWKPPGDDTEPTYRQRMKLCKELIQLSILNAQSINARQDGERKAYAIDWEKALPLTGAERPLSEEGRKMALRLIESAESLCRKYHGKFIDGVIVPDPAFYGEAALAGDTEDR